MEVLDERKADIRKEVDRIMDKPNETERLRDAFSLWLKVNPKIEVSYSDGSRAWVTAKVAYKQTLEKIRFLRSQHDNEFGVRADGKAHSVGGSSANWRNMMEFPPGSIEFMRMFAVQLFDGSGQEQKKAVYHLAKIFPELVVPNKI